LKRGITDHIGLRAGGPLQYTGKDMHAAHKDLHITLLSLRKEIRENNEREDKERHGTSDAQSEHSAISLPLFTVSHLFSSQGHVRSSFLAHKDERIDSRLL
jgi:hypothetical protein